MSDIKVHRGGATPEVTNLVAQVAAAQAHALRRRPTRSGWRPRRSSWTQPRT